MGVKSRFALGVFGLMVLGHFLSYEDRRSSARAHAATVREQKEVASRDTNEVPTCHVTFNNFEQLYDGMSYDSAVGTLGCSGREESRSEDSGDTTVLYQWDGAGRNGASAAATFENDKLVSKEQYGLN